MNCLWNIWIIHRYIGCNFIIDHRTEPDFFGLKLTWYFRFTQGFFVWKWYASFHSFIIIMIFPIYTRSWYTLVIARVALSTMGHLFAWTFDSRSHNVPYTFIVYFPSTIDVMEIRYWCSSRGYKRSIPHRMESVSLIEQGYPCFTWRRVHQQPHHQSSMSKHGHTDTDAWCTMSIFKITYCYTPMEAAHLWLLCCMVVVATPWYMRVLRSRVWAMWIHVHLQDGSFVVVDCLPWLPRFFTLTLLQFRSISAQARANFWGSYICALSRPTHRGSTFEFDQWWINSVVQANQFGKCSGQCPYCAVLKETTRKSHDASTTLSADCSRVVYKSIILIIYYFY